MNFISKTILMGHAGKGPSAIKEKHPGVSFMSAEKMFAWLSRFRKILCAMHKTHHLFYLHCIVKERNLYIHGTMAMYIITVIQCAMCNGATMQPCNGEVGQAMYIIYVSYILVCNVQWCSNAMVQTCNGEVGQAMYIIYVNIAIYLCAMCNGATMQW